ncbi:MotA/TolQ/ExbB proton channel family protein [Aporhodopirellula aestuarii]|uniref:MotA/TolQ/ExbB proton channel family protein n=1 Tax=Aporhodopirellula aestuarii TaxID=2950107 RepID=A0ABT0U374_9BACT|nr:MotA/TolQ/ExbB proton channel family protein [Aporhodopirellula aestuarii]MCM2371339.1 MotA/TolQ/ExbB proton channel family protein [Aporhodopirellula aestuarii]
MTQPPEPVSVSHQMFMQDSPARKSPAMALVTKLTPLAIGLAGGCAFYAVVLAVDWAPLNRYFLGHPVAVAATMLFAVAVSILAFMTLDTASQQRSMRLLRDADLMPPPAQEDKPLSPAQRWRDENDAGHAARMWRVGLSKLPAATRSSALVRRLDEVLTRQSHRTTTGELPEDLRELSVRDADAAHDSLGLIRIIVWAIPMLGFLGTVIGITQTLGGLDFTDGTAAVDRLKSGLYVAFDTTALGLVLSVVAIFLQFPVERGLQSLLVDIDERVRDLVSLGLPSENPADNQTAMITHLCRGIETAVAESLATQAKLWRETIEEAQEAWRSQHNEGAEQFRQLLQSAMKPALTHHADRIDASIGRLDGAAHSVENALREQTAVWRGALQETASEVQTHRRTLLTHTEAMTTLATRQSEQDASLRDALKRVVSDRNSKSEPKSAPALDPAVTQAMTTLARAVDLLSTRLPLPPERPTRTSAGPGRGARAAGNSNAGTRANGAADRDSLGRAA